MVLNLDKFIIFARSLKNLKKKYKMYLTTEVKKEIFKKFGKSESNTGSTEGQIALFTHRINYLTEHLKLQKKDFSTERALINLVGKRRSLLNYLQRRNIEKYRQLIEELNIRK